MNRTDSRIPEALKYRMEAEKIRPKNCNECQFYFDCRKSSIANAYGGLECAGKWDTYRNKPIDQSTALKDVRG